MPRAEFVEILDTRTGRAFVARLALPLHFGRKPEGPHSVVLDAAERTISSHHGSIERARDGLLFRDTSKNGTVVDGKRIHQSYALMRDHFVVEIRHYRIRPVAAAPVVIAYVSKHNVVEEHEELLPGNRVLLRLPGGRRRLAAVQGAAGADGRALATFQRSDGPVHVLRERDVPLTINNRDPVTGGTELKPGDVAHIAGERIEILTPDTNRIVCGHDPCRLLNPPHIHALCKWCGHDLANTNSVSRILLPGARQR